MTIYVPAEDRYQSMTYRRCGRSGLLLPAVSLGLPPHTRALARFQKLGGGWFPRGSGSHQCRSVESSHALRSDIPVVTPELLGLRRSSDQLVRVSSDRALRDLQLRP